MTIGEWKKEMRELVDDFQFDDLSGHIIQLEQMLRAARTITANRKHMQVVGAKRVIAWDGDTGDYLRHFDSMEELRELWPSAEIVSKEEYDTYIVVYC